MGAISIPDRATFVRRGLRLEYLTLIWNSLEAAVAVIAGVMAGSIALVGFGIDSVIECASGGALVWRLRTDSDAQRREWVEATALRLVGIGFLLLAAYVAFEAASTVLTRHVPDHSVPGILLAVASLIVMPLLARAKRRVAAGLGSNALHADSRQTDLCAYLSAILLAGLLLNAALGWWWADPVAGLVMVPIIAREGVAALRGEVCGCESPAANVQESCHGVCHEGK
jgi:divalent metal cation (Fe/Co/Zn/Cd) transporter